MTEAKVSVSWAVRMLIAGVAFVGFGSWSLYDGKIKYPAVEETFQQYYQAGRTEEWIAYAGEQGWKKEWKKDPHSGEAYVYSDWDIRTQFIMAAACLPIGLFILIRLVWTLPHKLGADEDALYAVNNVRIPYDCITDIDKRKWDRKGIAVVNYDVDGKKGKTKIDDWIFKGGAAILQEVETHVSPEIAGYDDEDVQDEWQEEEEPQVDTQADDASEDERV